MVLVETFSLGNSAVRAEMGEMEHKIIKYYRAKFEGDLILNPEGLPQHSTMVTILEK